MNIYIPEESIFVFFCLLFLVFIVYGILWSIFKIINLEDDTIKINMELLEMKTLIDEFSNKKGSVKNESNKKKVIKSNSRTN